MERRSYILCWGAIGCLVALILLGADVADSTTFSKMLTLQELCRASSHIVVARVDSMSSYVNEERNHIYTDIVLVVEQTLKGPARQGERLKLTHLGGTVDGITTFVVSAAQFRAGQETLLFLSEREQPPPKPSAFVVVGMAQGKFDVLADRETGGKRVVRHQVSTPLRLAEDEVSPSLTDTESVPLPVLLDRITSFVK